MTLTLNKPSAGTQNWDVPVNENWERIEQEVNLPIVDLGNSVSGSVSLAADKVYQGTFSGNTTFVLPTPPTDGNHHMIKLYMNLSVVSTINWGTTQLLTGTTPYIPAAGLYVILWDINSRLNNIWAVGSIGPQAL